MWETTKWKKIELENFSTICAVNYLKIFKIQIEANHTKFRFFIFNSSKVVLYEIFGYYSNESSKILTMDKKINKQINTIASYFNKK